MKITKQQIEFFEAYISDDDMRPVLQCLYLDMETLTGTGERRAKLVGTNGFALGSIELELTANDTESYLIPYKHLKVIKSYLKKDHEVVVVEFDKKEKLVYYKTPQATIFAETSPDQYPDYKKVINKEREVEYTVRVGVKLMKDIIATHLKLGYSDILIKMSGDKEPITLKNFDSRVLSIVMPSTITDKEEKGKLQK
jgi:DNA polymerase III sliding clamp (beta) subunit (PCNA family)